VVFIMGLFSKNKPKIKIETSKKDSFSGWIKCSGCLEMVHASELQNNLNCCPKCDYHYRINAKQRMQCISDEKSFEEMFSNIQPVDSLNFIDSQKYVDRLKEAKEKSSSDEAVIVGKCTIEERTVAIGVLDFSFMGGSMGSVVGERITLIIEYATKNNLPLVIVAASGGARMQESVLSLMQMAKTSAALTKLHEKKLPFISVLTNPTTGGVTASFASLGDIIIAEPDALIAFAGPRVVEQTIGQKLPDGAQKSEFLLEKGMIDIIVKRKDLKKKISYFVEFFMDNPRPEDVKDKLQQRLKQLLKFTEIEEKKFAEQ
jgi:acetyl-CoA carboxylase carboxyl transferase subunit beta